MNSRHPKQAFIDKHFNGDVQEYEKSMAYSSQFPEEVAYGENQTISWNESKQR